MNNCYTYVYRDPSRSNEPIYVGKGTGNRAYRHLKSTHNKHFAARLAKMKREGVEPIIEFLCKDVDDELAQLCEVEAIDLYGRLDLCKGPLLNHTDGGNGCSSEDAKRWNASLTPEQLSAKSRKAMDTMGKDGLKAKSRKAKETLGFEGMSAAAKKGSATMGVDGRSARARKTAETKGHERASEIAKKTCEDMGPEALSARAIKVAQALGPEGCSARSAKREANMPPETKSARANKGWETRRAKANAT